MGALRLLLALGVALSHFDQMVIGPAKFLQFDYRLVFGMAGVHAVLLFYVISGFLMSYVLEHKYAPGPAGTRQFYWARALRIYPMWFALLAAMYLVTHGLIVVVTRQPVLVASGLLVIGLALWGGRVWWRRRGGGWPTGGSLVPAALVVAALGLIVGAAALTDPRGPEIVLPSIFLLGSDWIQSLQILTTGRSNMFGGFTGVGWSLGAELTFYVIAPFVLRSRIATIGLFALSLGARVALYAIYPFGSPNHVAAAYFFFPGTLMFFLLGHMAREVWRLLPWRPNGLGLVLFAAAAVTSLGDPIGQLGGVWSHFGVVLFALALPGLFELTKDNTALNLLGDLTYPLYLFHELVIGIVVKGGFGAKFGIGANLLDWGRSFANPYVGMLAVNGVITAIIIGMAILLHFFIERPLRDFLERIGSSAVRAWHNRRAVLPEPVVEPIGTGSSRG